MCGRWMNIHIYIYKTLIYTYMVILKNNRIRRPITIKFLLLFNRNIVPTTALDVTRICVALAMFAQLTGGFCTGRRWWAPLTNILCIHPTRSLARWIHSFDAHWSIVRANTFFLWIKSVSGSADFRRLAAVQRRFQMFYCTDYRRIPNRQTTWANRHWWIFEYCIEHHLPTSTD